MIVDVMKKASRILSESKTTVAKRCDLRSEAVETEGEGIEFKDIKDDAYAIISGVLAVGVAQIEDSTGLSFESAKDAQDFLFKAFMGLRSEGKGTLTAALRKFDRLGGDRTKQAFRRTIK